LNEKAAASAILNRTLVKVRFVAIFYRNWSQMLHVNDVTVCTVSLFVPKSV